ncbi:MAG: DUF3392 domain-containing protein [Cellvibrionaceae bacterium]
MPAVLHDLLTTLSSHIRPHLLEISLAMIATLLVIYGNDINKLLKIAVRRWHFAFRTLAFIALCTFGYGLLTIYTAPHLAKQLSGVSSAYLPLVILTAFIALGVLAERKNHL